MPRGREKRFREIYDASYVDVLRFARRRIVPEKIGTGLVALAEQRREWTCILIERTGKTQSVCLMPNEDLKSQNPDPLMGGYFDSDAAPPPTVAPDQIATGVISEGQTDEGWFNWLEGYIGSDVTGVTVHTSSGFDIQASVANGRFAA